MSHSSWVLILQSGEMRGRSEEHADVLQAYCMPSRTISGMVGNFDWVGHSNPHSLDTVYPVKKAQEWWKQLSLRVLT
jgi:hypothetical protein